MNKIAILGFTVSDVDINNIINMDQGMPIQTHNFIWAFIKSLQSNGEKVKVISCDPVSNYPLNSRILFKSGIMNFDNVDGIKLPFINIIFIKHITRLISCIYYGTKFIKRNSINIVIIHGVHSPFILYGIFIKYIFKINSIIIITDPPGVILLSDSFLSKLLKYFDSYLIKYLLKFFNGAICLTNKLAKTYCCSIPTLVIDGIISLDNNQILKDNFSSRRETQFSIVYAGSVSLQYGVKNLVDKFYKLDAPNLVLNIYGKGDLSSYIKNLSLLDPRIIYHGFVSDEELFLAFQNADILINPRPNSGLLFPSKLFEYMKSGTAVLSTRMDGVYPELKNYLYFFDDDNMSNFDEAIIGLTLINSDILTRKGIVGFNYIKKYKSPKFQGSKIINFITHVCK